MLDPDEIMQRRGERLYGADGAELGTLEAVFLDDAQDRPSWVLVDGPGGRRFVPLDGASTQGAGLAVPYDAARVAAAPAVGDGDRLTPDDEAALRAHYAGGGREPSEDAPEVVLHEERLRVEARGMARRVRVRKAVVTEQQQVTVTVRREVLHVEEVPGDAGLVEVPDADAAPPEPLELVLHTEEVEVVTRVVPTERVRVHVDRVESTQQVAADLRRERVEVDRT